MAANEHLKADVTKYKLYCSKITIGAQPNEWRFWSNFVILLQAWVDNRMSSAGTVAAAPALAPGPGSRQTADYYPSSMLASHTPQRNRVGGAASAAVTAVPLGTAGRGRPMGVRASYNERLTSRYQPNHQHYHPPPLTAAAPVRELVYRSNSSLEIEQDEVGILIFFL